MSNQPPAGPSRVWFTAAFLTAALVVAAAHVSYIIASVALSPVGFDTAYNLTVSRNVAGGLGYTSDGYLLDHHVTEFDYRISTGPTVLIPLALGFVGHADGLTWARLAMAGWYTMMIVGFAALGRQTGGRWLALLLALVPLSFDVYGSPGVAELRGASDVLGEVPATGLILVALILTRQSRVVGGLFVGIAVGLAVLTKTIAALGVPALAIGLLLAHRESGAPRGRRLSLFFLGVLAPTILWQVFILVSLGLDAYRHNLASQVGFLVTGGSGLDGQRSGTNVREFFESWHAPSPVVVVVTIAGLATVVLAVITARRARQLPGRAFVGALTALVVVALLWVGWWMFLSTQPYSRSLYPGAILLMAALVTGLWWSLGVLSTRMRDARLDWTVAALALSVVVLLPSSQTLAATVSPSETIAEQRRKGDELADASGVIRFDPDDFFSFAEAYRTGWASGRDALARDDP